MFNIILIGIVALENTSWSKNHNI